jgi:hypothetical protein
MPKAPSTFDSDYFRLWVTRTENDTDVTKKILHITDRFHHWRHAPERAAFGGVTRLLENYLTKRSHLTFNHPKNHARRVVYMTSAVKAWAQFMPGGYATYPVHNPDVKQLSNGHKIDYVTRNLFRHSSDAIGLRSRAYAMSWYVHAMFGARDEPLHWLSIAAGTGQPTFDASRLFSTMPKLYLTDINTEILAFAKELAKKYSINETYLVCKQLDISDDKALKKMIHAAHPLIVEMMGLMEYLDDKTAVSVMKIVLPELPSGAVFIFTNMRTDHPELLTHKHAVGWPGVLQRSIDEVLSLIEQAGVKRECIDVLLPDDNVYAVYCIRKA